MHGVVVKFDTQRGFGFVRSKQLSEDAFVHITAVRGRRELSVGQTVTFEVTQTDKGLAAVDVVPGRRRLSPYALYGLIAAALTGTLAVWLSYQGWPGPAAYFAAVNLTTLVFYGFDKKISGSSILRVPEIVLHGLAFAGGSPAALAGQKLCRRKTIKRSFRVVYWGIVLAQAGVLLFLPR